MEKIIALEQKGFLENGGQVYEWEQAKEMMSKHEVSFFEQYGNVKNRYYFQNFKWGNGFLSILKDELKVKITGEKNLNEILDTTTTGKPKFKVGDKLRVKGSTGVLTVKEIVISYGLTDDTDLPLNFEWQFNESFLEPIEPEPEEKKKRYYLNISRINPELSNLEIGLLTKPLQKYHNTEFVFGLNQPISEQNKDGIAVLKAWCNEK